MYTEYLINNRFTILNCSSIPIIYRTVCIQFGFIVPQLEIVAWAYKPLSVISPWLEVHDNLIDTDNHVVGFDI